MKMSEQGPKIDFFPTQLSNQLNSEASDWYSLVSLLFLSKKKTWDPGFFLTLLCFRWNLTKLMMLCKFRYKRFCYRSWIEIIVEGFPCLKRIISRRGLPRSLVILHIWDENRKSSTSQLVKSFQIPSVKLAPLQKKKYLILQGLKKSH